MLEIHVLARIPVVLKIYVLVVIAIVLKYMVQEELQSFLKLPNTQLKNAVHQT